MSDPSDHVVSTPGFKMDLPKFSGSPGTFHAWSIRMKMALKLRGDDVWAAVEAGASSSGGPSSATRSSARRPTAGDHANLTAANLIASTLSGYPLLLFTNGEADVNAGQGWARLKDHYASQDRLRIAELKEAQLHVPCGNLARFFERHMELQQQLQDAGVRQDNEDLFTIVWKQLPRWTAPLTLPYFASGRRGFSNNSNNHGRQGRNNGNSNGNSNGKGRRFRGNCHYCGKYGHRAAECRKKQRDNGATGFTAQAQHQHGQDAATFVAATATTPTQLHDPLTWLADTGASHHLTFVKDAFVELTPHLQQHHPRHITAFGGTRVPVRGVGSVLLHARTTSGARMQIVLQECLYVPEGQANLIALGRLTRDSSGRPTGHSQRDGADGHYVRFSHGAEVKLKERNSLRCWPIVAVGPSTAHGLTADACKQPQQPAAAPAAQSKAHTPSMHEVLGHRNDNDVQQYCKLMGIDDRNAISSKQCTTCAVTKSTRHSVSKHAERTQVPGERIHADIVDWTADSPTGKRYSLVIVDEGSKLLHAVHLNAKKDAVAAFQSFLRETKLPISPTTTALQTDSDAIFLGADFQAIVKKHLKQHQQSPPYTQAQNGIVERQVRTLSDMVRAMITDVSFACGLLCRYMDRYTTVHWQAAKHVVRYLKATSEHGLLYKRRSGTRKDQPLDLVCYSDASFGTDQLTGRSTTGFTCYINGCLVSWSSRLQPTVALSTAEAEYMAISAAAQDVVFLRQLLMDLDEPEAGATKMLTDNQAAIAIGNDHVTKPRTKHIRVRHHFVRELIADGTIVLQHCPGTQMVADALTKALDKQTFEQHLPRLVGTSTAEAEQRKAVEGEC
ncbi:hypothetical protein PTSG_13200 [Salpingoeca rosetta]|uniref:Integrase catalytic domain-containing protein n=1 Tax=Salpingoeca rosetta (strain ATCC 50818 / BSB-021) TaxID=946362 RepID=F2UTK4_SALR5|nr:uncharacterized protein PTSG_13200 [Salpingoeca rosetta]EGD72977.1 hypothetical protein PTSG_13200 [Salpingoeca rosetta]|eukprot:XP_004987499.1 hypothetical protein PTSG_13200 [Salpingoeca rosetta]